MTEITIKLVLDPRKKLHVDFLQWNAANPNAITDATLLGYYILDNGLIDTHCTTLTDTFRQKHQLELEAKNKQIENITTQLKINQDHFDTNLKSRIDDLSQLYKDQIATLKAALVMRESSLHTIVNEQVDVLRKQLAERDIEIKTLKASNHVKGATGERILVRYLQQHFPEFETENRGHHGHEADIHMVNSKNEMYVVESKYKDRITNTDIDKFYRDITQLSASHKILGGIFVSIKCRSIPTKGSLAFEQRGGIPVMFIAFDNQDEVEASLNRYMKLFMDVSLLMVDKAEENDENKVIMERLATPFSLIKKNKARIEKIRNEHLAAINKMVLELEHDNMEALMMIEELIGRDVHPSKKRKQTAKALHECAACKRTFKTAGGLTSHSKRCDKSE